MANMFQEELLDKWQKMSTMQHALQEWIYHMLINELLKKYPCIGPEEAPLIILDSKSAVCMDNNGNNTKNKMHINRRLYFVRNGET